MAKHQISSWSHGPATRNSCALTSGLFKSTTNSAFQVPELRITKKRNVVHARAPYQPATLFFDPLATRARCPAGLLHCNHAKRLTNPWGNKASINAPKEPWILWGSKKYDRKNPYKPQPSTLIVFLVWPRGARDHVNPYQAMAVPGMCKQTNKKTNIYV